MRTKYSLFLFTTLTFYVSYCQKSEFRRLTIVSYEYSHANVAIDTSIYNIRSESTPLYKIEYWMHLGSVVPPVLYSEFDPERNDFHSSNDTIRHWKNKVVKVKSYNELIDEWFVYHKRKKISPYIVIYWQTFYHEFHKTYFTSKTTMKFDKNGYLRCVKTFDKYLRKMESKEIYMYE